MTKSTTVRVRVKTAGVARVRIQIESAAAKKQRQGGHRPQGVVLYKGPSLLDGSPIICVATGIVRPSKNPKTGKAIQCYILAYGRENPIEARRSGGDYSICGDCPHRDGTCYVDLSKPPLAVFRAAKSGTYPRYNRRRHATLFEGRFVRGGAYGDPAAVPVDVWKEVFGLAAGRSSYTHQWATCDSSYAEFCQASVETLLQRWQAIQLGYSTFRVRTPDQPLDPGGVRTFPDINGREVTMYIPPEFECPASEEQGRRLTCDECGACSGKKQGSRNATPTILFHGSRIAGNRSLRMYERTMQRLEGEERAGLFALPTVN